VIKEGMFQYKYRLGKRIKSQAIIANAWEHRSDVYSSIAALIGILAAVLGGELNIPWLIYFDPLAGAVVSLMIMRMAYKIGYESVHNTLDHVLHENDAKKYRETAEQINGVLHIDDFFAREHGHYLIIDIKIGVNPQITVEKGHEIADEVKKTMMSKFSDVRDVFVHVNPYQDNYKYHDTTNGSLLQ